MTEVHPQGITMIAMAAVAAAEAEADITRRDHMTEEALWTVMLAAGPIGTTVLVTPTEMTGMVAPAMGQGGLAPPAHTTGIPGISCTAPPVPFMIFIFLGHEGITEAGAMRGRQGLHCLQDRLWLQDIERRMHSQGIK